MNQIAEDILMHYGTKRHSGRYPWGSGENPYQHSIDIYNRIRELEKTGISEAEIAAMLGLRSSTELRKVKKAGKNAQRSDLMAKALQLKDQGMSNAQIAEELGLAGESSVRSLLNQSAASNTSAGYLTAEFLKEQIAEKGMIDVGVGVERELGISRTQLDEALYLLEQEGYVMSGGRIPQMTNPGKMTTLKVICPPDTPKSAIFDHPEDIHSVTEYTSEDGGKTFETMRYPASMDSDRLMIRYAEEGGVEMDGVILLRQGVPDLSMGESHYAQVRILVDDDHYLKGMAMYGNDSLFPEGVDIIFNTNKSSDVAKMDVLKEIDTKDPNNPFGALIKSNGQTLYFDENGNEQLGLINKTREEGDWDEWGRNLPAQFLSKQPKALAEKQLNLTIADKQAELDDILSLTNPTLKRYLLESYADDCDTAAVNLKAAALPRQRFQVILPVPEMSDTEIYAPQFKDGETVALIRYPHGGTFEIPILKVNNKQPNAKDILSQSLDAVGINSNVAARLSGADFDGDTVMVIPCNSSSSKVYIQSTSPLKGLEGFDPKAEYPYVEGMKVMPKSATGRQMGVISNLITDMTLKGANDDELARAVRHSMVVIDAAKHKLNYKLSEEQNGIAELKKIYQPKYDENGDPDGYGGASTLISLAKSPVYVTKRQGQAKIDPNTGEKIYKVADDAYYIDRKTGKEKERTQKSTRMAETKDAYELSTGTFIEDIYAGFANKMKSLANEARKATVKESSTYVGKTERSPSAAKTYAPQVASLMDKLNDSLKNAPRERQAQVLASAKLKVVKQDNDIDKKTAKKLSQIYLKEAREAVGARRVTIDITPKEWEAIQAGAISDSKLLDIFRHTDTDVVRNYALPKVTSSLSDAKINKINAMRSSGYTVTEIAEALGVSNGTVTNYLKK